MHYSAHAIYELYHLAILRIIWIKAKTRTSSFQTNLSRPKEECVILLEETSGGAAFSVSLIILLELVRFHSEL